MVEGVVVQVSKQNNYLLKVYYAVRFRGSVATFVWSSSPKSSLKSSVDLKVRVNPKEIFWLARCLNCSFRDGIIFAPNFDVYNRLIIYAFVRPTIRSDDEAKELRDVVINMGYVDAFYWASKFREAWWNNGNYKSGLKLAKAFRLFFR
ncbi:MAG: hypothetical protein ACP5IZ_08025 [Thermoprotei archaeon]